MQFFEILCIVLGALSGALMALLPAHEDPRKPLAAIGAFSLSLALLIFFLPVIVNSANFVLALTVSLVAAVLGFAAMKAQVTIKTPHISGSGVKVTSNI